MLFSNPTSLHVQNVTSYLLCQSAVPLLSCKISEMQAKSLFILPFFIVRDTMISPDPNLKVSLV